MIGGLFENMVPSKRIPIVGQTQIGSGFPESKMADFGAWFLGYETWNHPMKHNQMGKWVDFFQNCWNFDTAERNALLSREIHIHQSFINHSPYFWLLAPTIMSPVEASHRKDWDGLRRRCWLLLAVSALTQIGVPKAYPLLPTWCVCIYIIGR